MVTVTKSVEPAKFQPVKIELVLETEEELAALLQMSQFNVRIPRLVATGSTDVTRFTAEQRLMFHAMERVILAIAHAINE
jgi:hypothetical protein